MSEQRQGPERILRYQNILCQNLKVVVKDTLDPGELGKMILNLDNVGHIKEEGSIEVSCDVGEHQLVITSLIEW